MSTETITIPAGIDIHVHFREPGNNKSETIASGSRAAMMGGFALALDMPNNPGRPTKTAEDLLEKHEITERDSYIPMGFYAGAQPEHDNAGELERMAPLAIGLKLYMGKTTGNPNEYQASDFKEIVGEWHRVAPKKPIMVHRGNVQATDVIGLIAQDNKHQLHICHETEPSAISQISKAKSIGLPVTVGVCPHHLLMTSKDYETRGPFADMMPPLADPRDVEALEYDFMSGAIDIIESDHAPHPKQAKMEAMEDNGHCHGVPGVEFVMPLLFWQVKKGRYDTERLIEATSTKPADIVGVKLSPRTEATWKMETYRIAEEEKQVASSSKWTPYLGMLAVGRLEELSINRKTVYAEGSHPTKVSRVVNRGDEI